MSRCDMKGLISSSPWSEMALAARWLLSPRRIRQIITDVNRPPYYDDALFHVLSLPVSISARCQMTAAEIQILLAERHIPSAVVAERWRLSLRRVGQIIGSDHRPLYIDDAFMSLPARSECESFEWLTNYELSVADLSVRWGISVRRLTWMLTNALPDGYLHDAIRGAAIRCKGQSGGVEPIGLRQRLFAMGWGSAELSLRWGLTSRRINQIFSSPTPIFVDAFFFLSLGSQTRCCL